MPNGGLRLNGGLGFRVFAVHNGQFLPPGAACPWRTVLPSGYTST